MAEGDSRSLKERLKRFGILAGATLLFLFLLIRWLPTASYEGTVQRVYEKVGEYRVEVFTQEGEVRVFTNSEMRFPYLKFNTADVQANLDRAAREGDLVHIEVWGVRSSFFSAFPNVLDLEVLEQGEAVRRSRNDRIVRAVMGELRARRLVDESEAPELQKALLRVIDEADAQPRLPRD